MIQWEGGSLLREMGDSVIVGGPREKRREEKQSREASDSSSRFLRGKQKQLRSKKHSKNIKKKTRLELQRVSICLFGLAYV